MIRRILAIVIILDGGIIRYMSAMVIVIGRSVIVECSRTLIDIERPSFDLEIVNVLEESCLHCAAGDP